MHKNDENTIFFLKDANNQKFVLKEQATAEPAIHEKLGADIGTDFVNINQVEVFSPNHPITSAYTNKIATLHTFVPGTIAYESDITIDNLHAPDFCGGLSYQEQFTWLAHSESMCDIVALDLFINNADRHLGNYAIEIDNQNNIRSHAFDLDWTHVTAYDLPNIDCTLATQTDNHLGSILSGFTCAHHTYDYLDQLDKEREGQYWPKEEIKVLNRINETLGKLIVKYPSYSIYAKWMDIAQQAGYSYCYLKQQYIKVLIERNYRDLELLRNKIDTIIAKQADIVLAEINDANPSQLHYISQKAKQLINRGKQKFIKEWYFDKIGLQAIKITMYSLYLSRINKSTCTA